MSNVKIKQLLSQKEKLEHQLQIEAQKRFTQIGKRAEKYGLLEWSNSAFDALFKQAREQGEQTFLNHKSDT